MKRFPLGSCGLQNLNQQGEPGCIDVVYSAEIRCQDLTARGLQLAQQDRPQVRGRVNCNPARERDLALGVALFAYCPNVGIERYSLHFSYVFT